MRWGFSNLIALALVGCAAKPVPAPAPVAQASESVYDRATVASALLYDPPLVASGPRIEISRAGRAPEAYAGYEELTTTYYYLYQDDRQLGYGGGFGGGGSWRNHDRFERQAITQRVGVSYR
jgi:hypothetical protein